MGVELFQIDSYDPKLAGSSPADPIQLALGILGGELDPSATASLHPTSAKIGVGAPAETPVVTPL